MAKSSTSFKKGNQAALGCETSGRPPKYDLAKEAKELQEWSKRPDALAIYNFTFDKEYCVDDLDNFAARSPEFSLAYKKAKERVGQNREAHCNAGSMNYGVWNRSATIYHPHLRNHEREDKLFEIEAKMKLEAQSKVTSTPEEVETNKAFLAQVKKLQDSLERSIADKSKSTESKS